jgi:hypothetical protein
VKTYSAESFGILPDSPYPMGSAIQVVLDSFPPAGTLELGSGTYNLQNPLFLGTSSIKGQGFNSILASSKGPCLILGYPPVSSQALVASRPDSFGILDTSASPTKGYRWGFSTNQNLSIQAQATALDLGTGSPTNWQQPNYWNISELSLDICIQRTGLWNGPLLGMSSSGGQTALPFFLSATNSAITLIWNDLTLTTPLPSSTQTYRITLAVSQSTGTAWINGKLSPTIFSAMHKTNAYDFNTPFLIGCTGPTTSTPQPFQLHGFHLRQGLAARTERSLNDLQRYFTKDASTIAFLPFQDPPSSKFLSIQEQVFQSIGLILPPAGEATNFYNKVENLQTLSKTQASIALLNPMHCSISNVKATGMQGIGSINTGASYLLKLQDLELNGYDTPYYGYCQILNANNILLNSGIHQLRERGGQTSWKTIIASFQSSNAESFYHCIGDEYGVTHRLTDVTVDNEVNAFSSCVCHLDQSASNANWTVVDGLYVANMLDSTGKQLPVFKLVGHGIGGEYTQAKLSVSKLSGDPRYSKVCELVEEGPGIQSSTPSWSASDEIGSLIGQTHIPSPTPSLTSKTSQP